MVMLVMTRHALAKIERSAADGSIARKSAAIPTLKGRVRAPLLLALLICLLSGCENEPESRSLFSEIEIQGPLDLHLCGFTFPAHIGNFRRIGFGQYNQAGTDISISYGSTQGIAATIYVYPTHGHPLATEFAAREAELEHFHGSAQRLTSGNGMTGPQHAEALEATYALTDTIDSNIMNLQAELIVAQHKNQFVAYRFTWPAKLLVAQEEVQHFSQTFAWP